MSEVRLTSCPGGLFPVHSDLPVQCPVYPFLLKGSRGQTCSQHRETRLLLALLGTCRIQPSFSCLLPFCPTRKTGGLREKVRKGQVVAREVLRDKQEEEERVGWRWEDDILSIFAAMERFTENFTCVLQQSRAWRNLSLILPLFTGELAPFRIIPPSSPSNTILCFFVVNLHSVNRNIFLTEEGSRKALLAWEFQ